MTPTGSTSILIERLRAAPAARGVSLAAATISREEVAWTRAQLIDHQASVAARLAGLSRPPRVAAALPSGPEFTAVQLGCLQAGAMFLPMPHTLTAREARHYLALLPPDLVVAEGASAAIYRDAGATDIVDFGHLCAGPLTIRETPTGTCPPDARMLQFTSGSTGRPRGALITEQNLLANLARWAARSRSNTSARHRRSTTPTGLSRPATSGG
jgi:acyl-CoA synthetase (AMP-forming)/AMP-acid ligase II